MLQVNVIGASSYSFNDKDSGRLVEGVNVWYTRDAETSDEVGQIPQKVSLSLAFWGEIKSLELPSKCELITEQKLGKKGVYNKVTGLKPVKEF